MTVEELIAELSRLPRHLDVLLPSGLIYEHPCSDVEVGQDDGGHDVVKLS